eukprot:CAMPEP_0113958740 /NCGR_PEP_ID=MMETSP0011_2-20120614/3670_1 /TAXON_ID=101924 /ORGANISM="Rhodosorus marinus" /LENGTH=968 /DNA_ID=CAMNT_0000969801 /DNA_START=354 /DNA_END=3257 /DNA_ORIENTATION=+ /assembly_acc=CAM_ASM_000156
MLWSDHGQPRQGFTGGGGMCRRDNYPLFHEVPSGGAEVVVYVEMACNGLFGAGRGGDIEPPDPDCSYTLSECGVSTFDAEAWQLLQRVTFLEGCATSLPVGSTLKQTALHCANRVINAVDVLDKQTYGKGLEIVDKSFLQSGTSRPLDSSEFTRTGVTPMVFAIGNCHIDTAWLWPYAETRRKCARTWSTQIRNMEMHPEYKFVCSQAQQLEWVKEDYPSLYQEIKEWHKKGQFLVTGGTWIEMDCNMPSGESLVRQFLTGQRFFEREFGAPCDVFWLPDTFGYSSQLPQIMRSAGIEFFLTQKLSWNLFNKFPHSVFRWEGLDGSEVIGHFPPADSYNTSAKVDEVIKTVQDNKDAGVLNAAMMLFGHGDGGGGPSTAMIESLRIMRNNVPGLPEVVVDNAERFFEHAAGRYSELPRWVGELYFELHRGTYTSQAMIKKGNRKAELSLRKADLVIGIFASVRDSASEHGVITEFSDLLSYCWKLLLLHQFHDTLPGTCIRPVVEEAEAGHRKILEYAQRVSNDLLFGLTGITSSAPRVEERERENEKLLVLFNPNAFLRTPLVLSVSVGVDSETLKCSTVQQVDKETSLVVVEDVPSSIALTVSPKTMRELQEDYRCSIVHRGDRLYLKNGQLKVEMGLDGRLYSLILRGAGNVPDSPNFVKGCANRFVLYDDVSLFWDAWDVEAYNFEKCYPVDSAVSFKIIETGPLRASLQFEYVLGSNSRIMQSVSIESFSNLLTFENFVTWHLDRKMLRVEFNTFLRSPTASYETQYGYVQRPTHFNTSWDAAKFEVCGHRYADLSERNYGLAILNDCKYGYSVRDSLMRLSLLRSPKSPDDLCDMGDHQFKYALLPHAGSFPCVDVMRSAVAFNQSAELRVFSGNYVAEDGIGEMFALEDENEQQYKGSVLLDCVKKAEDGYDLVLRLYESLGGTETVRVKVSSRLGFKRAMLCNIMEENTGELEAVEKSDW